MKKKTSISTQAIIQKTNQKALEYIEHLQETNHRYLEYAKKVIEGHEKVAFLQDDLWHCNFGGYLIALVIICPGIGPGRIKIHIMDADDWSMELYLDTVEQANKLFDELFVDSPTYDPNFERKLKSYGFIPG